MRQRGACLFFEGRVWVGERLPPNMWTAENECARVGENHLLKDEEQVTTHKT